jgi:hypothetical protein
MTALTRFMPGLRERGKHRLAADTAGSLKYAVSLIAREPVGVGLHDAASFQKQQARLIGRHSSHKGSGLVKHFAHVRHGRAGVNRRVARQTAEIRIGIAGAANFVDKPLRCEPERFANRRPRHGPKRQNPVMDRQQVHKVARLPPSSRRHDLVGSEVNRMQHITESVVALRREKSIIGIHDPFELGRLAALAGNGGIHGRFAAQPLQVVAVVCQHGAILLHSSRHPFLAVVENVDVAGIARRVDIQGGAARNIAFRIAMRCKQAQNVRLNLNEGHGGTLPRFAQPAAAPASPPRPARRP